MSGSTEEHNLNPRALVPLYRACVAAIEATGGASYWKGKTHAFLLLCEAAVAEAAGIEAVKAAWDKAQEDL